MTKYRFKTAQEFKDSRDWNFHYDAPSHWNENKRMNNYFGQPVPDEYNYAIENGQKFDIPNPEGIAGRWVFRPEQVVLNETARIIKDNSNLISDVYEIEL